MRRRTGITGVACVLVVAGLIFGIAAQVGAYPCLSYYNDTTDATIYKYLLFNPSSTFEIYRVEIDAPGALSMNSPGAWIGSIAGGKAIWTTTPGTVNLGPGAILGGFELHGTTKSRIRNYTSIGQQYTWVGSTIAPLPEPGSIATLGTFLLGFGGIALRRLRR